MCIAVCGGESRRIEKSPFLPYSAPHHYCVDPQDCGNWLKVAARGSNPSLQCFPTTRSGHPQTVEWVACVCGCWVHGPHSSNTTASITSSMLCRVGPVWECVCSGGGQLVNPHNAVVDVVGEGIDEWLVD